MVKILPGEEQAGRRADQDENGADGQALDEHAPILRLLQVVGSRA